MVTRLFKDIWSLIKGMRQLWKVIRFSSKEELRLKKLVAQIGPIAVFLQHFESVSIDNPNYDTIRKIMLIEFAQALPRIIEEEEVIEEDLESYLSYCKMYNLDISLLNEEE
tara:strand:- start:1701 stop:2033 length:333 start_codon:yes stop_codon:yes gene_type:complete